MKKTITSLLLSIIIWSINGMAQSLTIDDVLAANAGSVNGHDQSDPNSPCTLNICKPGTCPSEDQTSDWSVDLSWGNQLSSRIPYPNIMNGWRLDSDKSKLDFIFNSTQMPLESLWFDPVTLKIRMTEQNISSSAPPDVCIFN